MLKIYGPKQSSGFRSYWLLEELGVAYEQVVVNFQAGEHKSAEYLKLNPNGKVPTLVDGEFVLWESMAINSYLLEKTGSDLGGRTLEERALITQWSLWAAIHLHSSLDPLIMQVWRKTPDNDETKNARETMPRWLTILNAHLNGREYMVGDRFSTADINVYSSVMGVKFVNYDVSEYPNIVAWMARLETRPAMQKVVAK